MPQLPHLVQGRCDDARKLAKMLGQRGWLTIYQINQLLLGRGKNLVYGPYHVLDVLGQGGLSQVFKARHREHHWLAALKVLRPEALESEEGRFRFLQEMEAMARLDHPNIVQFCDVDQADDIFYFAMEFVEGTDLGKYVRLSGPLPVAEACEYIYQAALGLQHAHERNLVHRDIKPVNLFLTHVSVPQSTRSKTAKQGREGKGKQEPLIKILDWGLANLRTMMGRTQAQMIESMAKGIIGTADYLSPEQARSADTVDIRGDIYSLGCTFYYLLTRRAPFPTGSLMQKLMQHQQAEPEPVRRTAQRRAGRHRRHPQADAGQGPGTIVSRRRRPSPWPCCRSSGPTSTSIRCRTNSWPSCAASPAIRSKMTRRCRCVWAAGPVPPAHGSRGPDAMPTPIRLAHSER